MQEHSNFGYKNNKSNFIVHEPDTFVIKGKFKLVQTGIYGIFAILLDKEIRKETNYQNFLELYTIVSYFSDLYETDLQESWYTLEKRFNQIRIAGDFATSLTSLFYQEFYSRFANSTGFTHTLIDDCRAKNFEKIEKWLAEICNQIQKDRQIEIRVFAEEIYSHELSSVREMRKKQESKKQKEDEQLLKLSPPQNASPVPTRPILAPTGSGILVKQLKLNTKVLVQLDSNSSKYAYWKECFRLSENESGQLPPLVATVHQIGSIIKNRVDILVTLSDTLYSRFTLESGIKIKPFNADSPQTTIELPSSSKQKEKKEFKSLFHHLIQDKGFIILLFAIIVLALLSSIFYYNSI